MKVILFLSRFTLICNIAFLLFALFSWMERSSTATVARDQLSHVPFWKELIIILGVSSIIVNIIMSAVYLVLILMRKKQLPWAFIITTFLFLGLQIFYFYYK
jgi:hypothetical protein